jgi:transposase
LKRTWSPRGRTPTIRTSLEHNERLNLLGVLCVTPGRRKLKLHLQSHRKPISGEQVIVFLAYLLTVIPGPIVMVWDKHPIHRRCKVKDWLAHHPRLRVYEFPTSAPELNPTEYVWTQVSESTANTAPHNGAELRANVDAGISRTRRSQSRLWACIFGSDLPWER